MKERENTKGYAWCRDIPTMYCYTQPIFIVHAHKNESPKKSKDFNIKPKRTISPKKG